MQYIIYGQKGMYRMTTLQNYERYVQNAREINYFDDFDTIDEVLEYVKKYFSIPIENIIISITN